MKAGLADARIRYEEHPLYLPIGQNTWPRGSAGANIWTLSGFRRSLRSFSWFRGRIASI